MPSEEDSVADTLPVILSDVERSDAAAIPQPWPTNQINNAISQSGQTTPPPTSWKSENKATKAICRPKFITIAGIIVLLCGAAFIAAGITVSSDNSSNKQASAGDSTATNKDGVPLNATRPQDSSEDGVQECHVELGDWDTYRTAADSAERQFLGSEVTNYSPDQLAAALNLTKKTPLLIGLSFWVPTSKNYPWEDSILTDITEQLSILNTAFAVASISFNTEAVLQVDGSDDDVQKCGAMRDDDDENNFQQQLRQQLGKNSSLMHVLLCEPEGVNGETPILGSEYDAGNGPALVVLRRAALWHSRTSLVHQIGHVLGLPHPFPDSETCKYDADTIVDTPQQYRGSVGCEKDASGALCDDAVAAGTVVLPQFNFMDISNDTCRQYFSGGQILRMHSLLAVLRPQIYNIAKLQYQMTPIPLRYASQSGLPTLSLLNAQIITATNKNNNDDDDSTYTTQQLQALDRLTNTRTQALLPINNQKTTTTTSVSTTSTSSINVPITTGLDGCSCVGPDGSGSVFWVGELDGGYNIDAVQLVQPWEVVRGAPPPPPPPSTDQEKEEDDGGSGSDDDGNNDNSGGDDGGSLLWQLAGKPTIEIRIGYSTTHNDNTLCTTSTPTTLASPIEVVLCDKTIQGRFVSVKIVQPAQQSLRQMCICSVTPLSIISPAMALQPAAVAKTTGGILHLPTSVLAATQSTTVFSAANALTNSNGINDQTQTLGQIGVSTTTPTNCSATQLEDAPWWSINLGIDTYLITGVRFQTPFVCSNFTIKTGCATTTTTATVNNNNNNSGITVDVYVTDDPINPSRGVAGLSSLYLCATGVVALPGQVVDVVCSNKLLGRTVTLAARPRSSSTTSNTTTTTTSSTANPNTLAPVAAPVKPSTTQQQQVLSLCGVTLIGSTPASVPTLMSNQPGWQIVRPSQLFPQLTLPIDNDPSTCLSTNGTDTSTSSDTGKVGGSDTLWQLALDALQIVHSLQVKVSNTSSSSSSSSSSSPAVVSLIDASGKPAWSTRVDSKGSVMQQPPTPLAVVAVRVENFTSLCDVKLYVGGEVEDSGEAWIGSGSGGVWSARAWGRKEEVVEAVDDDRRSCGVVNSTTSNNSGSSSSGSSAAVSGVSNEDVEDRSEDEVPWLMVDIGQPAKLTSIKIISNLATKNVTVGVFPSSSDTSTSISNLWSKAQRCGGLTTNSSKPTDLPPWTEAIFDCNDRPEGSIVVIQGPKGGVLSVCDVQVLAQAAWIQNR